MRSNLIFALALLALLSLSLAQAASCPTQEETRDKISACIRDGQDAVLGKDGECTVVRCSPGTGEQPGQCADASSAKGKIDSCMRDGKNAIVFGKPACTDVKCAEKRGGAGGEQPTAGVKCDGTCDDFERKAGDKSPCYRSDCLKESAGEKGTAPAAPAEKSGAPAAPGEKPSQPGAPAKPPAGGSQQATGSEDWLSTAYKVGALIAASLAILGWFWTRGKKKRMGSYLTNIDSTYSSFKMNSRKCEAELYRIKELITEDLKKGKIDESTYGILERRVDSYLKEIKEQINSEK